MVMTRNIQVKVMPMMVRYTTQIEEHLTDLTATIEEAPQLSHPIDSEIIIIRIEDQNLTFTTDPPQNKFPRNTQGKWINNKQQNYHR